MCITKKKTSNHDIFLALLTVVKVERYFTDGGERGDEVEEDHGQLRHLGGKTEAERQ